MVTSSELLSRLHILQTNMNDKGIGLVALAPTPNMRYFLGFTPYPDERFCALLVSQNDARLIVPKLNAQHSQSNTSLEMDTWSDESGPVEALGESLRQFRLGNDVVLAVDETMRADHLLLLQDLIQPKHCAPSTDVISPQRIIKSKAEIEALTIAAKQADRAVMVGIEACETGVTERDIAEKISSFFRKDGADQVDFTLIAAGENGSHPHHLSSNRQLCGGDIVILDIGATINGYKSDITRVVSIGKPSPEVESVYNIVREANRRGKQAAKPGVKACDVDFAVREYITTSGYGPNFVHRTGHGLGIEVHEAPWITSTSDTILEPGMVFSIEPGIYIPGKFGIRVEDIIAVTEDGSISLNNQDRRLFIKN